MYTSILGPSLPSLAAHTRTNLAEIGFLFMARALGYMIGSLRGGNSFDKFPGHALLAGLLLVMSASLALAPIISQLWFLTLVLLLLGIGEGALDMGTNLLLSWMHRKNATPFLNALHFFFGVGSFLGPILVAQAIRLQGDIHWAYWIMALYPIILILGLLRQPSPTAPIVSLEETNAQVPPLNIFLVAAFFALYVGAEAGFGGWVYSYALAMKLDTETSAAFLTSVFWGSITIGRMIGIPLSTRLRPRIILTMDILGALTAVILMIALPPTRLVLWFGAIFLGLSLAPIFPTMLAFAGRRMPLTGKITRWFFVGASVGGMSLPWFIGLLFEAISPRVMLIAIFIDLALALIVFSLNITYLKASQNPDQKIISA